MNCELAKQEFSTLYDGTAAASLRVAVENHLRDCESCRLAFSQFGAAWDALGSFDVVEPPIELHNSIMSRIDGYEWAKNSKPSKWALWLNRGALAVGSVAILLIIVQTFQRPNRGAVPAGFGSGSSPKVQTTTPVASMPTPQLDDETTLPVIRMKPNAEISYHASITEGAKYDPATVRFDWTGTVDAKGELHMPLVGVGVDHPETIWIAYGRAGSEQLSLVYLPGTNVSERPSLGAFNGPLTELLRQIATARNVRILFEVVAMKHDPVVVLNDADASLPTRDLIARAIDGTQFRLAEPASKNDVLRIMPVGR